MMGKIIWEHTECDRCGGSGRYSFNLMHGDMCYGCNGKGVQLTKRGIAARQFLNDSLTVPFSDITPGMKLHNSYSGWEVVATIEGDTIRYTNGSALTDPYHGSYRRAAVDKAELAEKRQAALDYQATLTKAGAPRKR